MKIYSQEPKNWKDLQDLTSKFLFEIGYDCEVEKDIISARSSINIDVYAKNNKIVPNSIILCECKHWSSAIPQHVIHSFRSVISDIGANYGFIISKKGFQKASYEAVKNTNINLFNWNDFIDHFREEWIKSMTIRIHLANRALLSYVGVGFPTFFKNEYLGLNNEEHDKFEILTNYYFNTAFYSMEHDYRNIETKMFDVKYFEQNILRAEKEYQRTFDSYESFYDFLRKDGEKGIMEFDNLFKKQLRKDYSQY